MAGPRSSPSRAVAPPANCSPRSARRSGRRRAGQASSALPRLTGRLAPLAMPRAVSRSSSSAPRAHGGRLSRPRRPHRPLGSPRSPTRRGAIRRHQKQAEASRSSPTRRGRQRSPPSPRPAWHLPLSRRLHLSQGLPFKQRAELRRHLPLATPLGTLSLRRRPSISRWPTAEHLPSISPRTSRRRLLPRLRLP